ncbi:hypothetical protein RJ641_031229, partial [Dillenia turbinata]
FCQNSGLRQENTCLESSSCYLDWFHWRKSFTEQLYKYVALSLGVSSVMGHGKGQQDPGCYRCYWGTYFKRSLVQFNLAVAHQRQSVSCTLETSG